MKKIVLDTDYLIREYRTGRSCADLERELGVNEGIVVKRLKEAGVLIQRRHPRSVPAARKPVPVAELVAAYLAGESENALAKRYGVNRWVIRLRLIESGVSIRGQSDSELLKWSRMTKAERVNQVASAHAAVRGVPLTFAKQCRIAEGRERAGAHRTPTEDALRAMLSERGIDTISQQAIGPYNSDLGACPVAVEIFGGSWHWSGDHAARTPKRFNYLLNTGWHILAVQITARYPLTPSTADYVAAYIEQARRDPTARREYRVVRGAGELIAAGCVDDDQISIVPTFTSGRDLTTGRYATVPR